MNKTYIICFLLLIIALLYVTMLKKNIETYSSNNKLSVLILSYNRPKNLDKSIPELLKFNEVDEIIVLHGSKEFKKEYNNHKVKNVDDWKNNDEIYTLRKFKNTDMCKNEMVLLLDDDLYPSRELLNNMIHEYNNDNNNFYGPTNRLCKEGYIYNPGEEYNYILTGIILTSKSLVRNVYGRMKLNKKLYDLVIKQLGNCEDLLFNHEFTKLYKKRPIFVKGTVKNLDTNNGFSTKDPQKHHEMRNNFCLNL